MADKTLSPTDAALERDRKVAEQLTEKLKLDDAFPVFDSSADAVDYVRGALATMPADSRAEAVQAFLAQLSEEQVTSLLHRKGLHAYTHATLVSPLHLKEDLAQTRKRGYSFDDEEHALGLRCVAACIYDEHREPFAAISISGPISRMTDDRVTELGALVIKAAKEVTLAYGGVK